MGISGKPKEIIEKSASIFSTFQLVVLVASIFFMVASLPITAYILVLVLVNTIWFFLCKDFVSNFKKEFLLMRLNVAIGITSVVNNFIQQTLTKVGSFSYVLSAMIGIMFITILFIENRKKEKAIQGFSLIKGKGKDSYKEDSFNRYKLKICNDKETGEDVYIYGKDRQVHTLLLGRVNCLLTKNSSNRNKLVEQA